MEEVAIEVPLRYPPNVIVPLVVIGLFEIVNPVVPPLRPTLVTVPVKAAGWNVAAKLVPFAVRTYPAVPVENPIVMAALVPASVMLIGDAAASTLEFGNAANEEVTVMNEMPLTVPLEPVGSAEMAPVVVRLVVPA